MRRTNRRSLVIQTLLCVAAIAAASGTAQAQGPALQIDPLVVGEGDQSVRVSGYDPLAPRLLVLWRFEAGEFRRLATRRSDAVDGRFDFGQQSWPIGAHRFHVAPAGVPPEGGRSVSTTRTLPSPRILSGSARVTEIEIAPALREGVILVRDAASGRLLLRWIVPRDPAARALLDLAAEGVAAQSDRVTFEHVLDDGRRSPPIHWPLGEPR